MFMRKQGMPEVGELVVCKIIKIFPNSAYAELIEYGKTGMIHVSEVALKWVRDIREFLKLNQHVVCKVMKVDGDNIFLSIKRVRKPEAEAKLNEFKKEKKAEKLLELAAKSINKDLDTAYEEVGFKLQDEFGSLHKAFEIAVKNPDLLKSKGVPGTWCKPIVEIAKKSFVEKMYELKAELNLKCYAPNGMEVIKNALLNAVKHRKNMEVKYISAPQYILISKGKNFRQIETELENAAEEIVKSVAKSNGEASFKIIEE